jgi:hypothetical protein
MEIADMNGESAFATAVGRTQEFRKNFANVSQALWRSLCGVGRSGRPARKVAPRLCGPDVGIGSSADGLKLQTNTAHPGPLPSERKPSVSTSHDNGVTLDKRSFRTLTPGGLGPELKVAGAMLTSPVRDLVNGSELAGLVLDPSLLGG